MKHSTSNRCNRPGVRRVTLVSMRVSVGLVGFFPLLLLAGCKPTTVSAGPNDSAPTPASSVPASAGAPQLASLRPSPPVVSSAPKLESCVEDAKPYTEAALELHLEKLASPELDGRAPGTAGDKAARDYIAARFRCLGLAPGGQDGAFEQPFVYSAGETKITTANVVAYRKGTDDKVGDQIIVVGAHHDHLGNGYLGANDNASGVAALLAIAQAVAQADAPKRTIAFVTFGAEEAGLVGSTFFVGNAPAALPMAKVVQYVNLDMVGSHSSRRVVYAFGAFAKLPSRSVLAKLDDKFPKLVVGLGGHSVRGDQVGFCKLGIPYVFFWTPDARCYHETCDKLDKIDLPRMTDITALAGGLVKNLGDTDTDLAAAKTQHGCRPR